MGQVFVVGALHLDVIVTAPHLPRIDETVVGHAVDYQLGGKGGNQAIAAARFGAQASIAGRVGSDEFGDTLLRHLDESSVDRSQVRRVDGASGMSAAIVDARGDYGAVIVSAANLGVDADEIALPEGLDVLLLQNELPERVNLAIARKTAPEKVVILNAAPARPVDDALLKHVDLLVVNRLEAAMLTGQDNSLPDPVTSARNLAAKGQGTVIVTLGGEGCVGCSRSGKIFQIPAFPVKAISTHGAGDAFTGALAAQLADGATLEDAVAFGQAAAALHVSVPVDARPELSAFAVRQFLQSRRT